MGRKRKLCRRELLAIGSRDNSDRNVWIQALSDLPNRRTHISTEVDQFVVSVGFDPRTGNACEVFFTSRGKVGQHLDHILYELGVTVSKLIQSCGIEK
jgi:hypothetical protein